jgi:hypothetical protein
MFSKWYPVFESVTFKSRIIQLPDDFVNYLHEDGIVVTEDNWIKRPKEDRFDEGEDPWSDEDVVLSDLYLD